MHSLLTHTCRDGMMQLGMRPIMQQHSPMPPLLALLVGPPDVPSPMPMSFPNTMARTLAKDSTSQWYGKDSTTNSAACTGDRIWYTTLRNSSITVFCSLSRLSCKAQDTVQFKVTCLDYKNEFDNTSRQIHCTTARLWLQVSEGMHDPCSLTLTVSAILCMDTMLRAQYR